MRMGIGFPKVVRRDFVTPWLTAGGLLLAVLLVLLPISPLNRHAISRDSGVFLYVGWRLLEGDTPYLHVWDHKPPGIYFLDALGLALGRGSMWGVWAVEGVSLGIAALLAFWVLKRLFDTRVAWIGTYLWMFSLTTVIAGGNLTQEYTLPLQFAMLALIVWMEYSGRTKGKALLFGLCLGAAFFIRQTAIGVGLAAVLFWLLESWRKRSTEPLWLILVTLVGVALVSLPIVGYFAWRGALAAFWDQAFRYNLFYIQGHRPLDRLLVLSAGLAYLARDGMVPLALMGYLLCASGLAWGGVPFAPEQKGMARLLLLALPVELVLVSLGGRPRMPYFMTLLPVLTLLAGVVFWVGFDYLGKALSSSQRWAILLALLGLFALVNVHDYDAFVRSNRHAVYAKHVIRYVKEHTSPEDTVLLIGAETTVNFVTRRRSPTRFVYQYPLYNMQYAGDTLLEAFYRDILANKPSLIIVTIGDGSIPNRFGANKTQQSEAMVYELDRLYQPVAKLDSWTIYARTGQP